MITSDEKAKAKELHARIRAAMKTARETGRFHPDGWPAWRWTTHRYTLLLWGFARGLPFRRLEREHHWQTLPDGTVIEHNLPSETVLRDLAEHFMGPPGLEVVRRWLADPAGAIAAPPPRPKKPFVRNMAAEE